VLLALRGTNEVSAEGAVLISLTGGCGYDVARDGMVIGLVLGLDG
jgi:hypothetical protein